MKISLTQSFYITNVSPSFIAELPDDDSVMKNKNSATIDIPKAIALDNNVIKHIRTIHPMFQKRQADLVFVTTEAKDFKPLNS